MATVPHSDSFPPAGTSLSPASSSTDSAVASTTFPSCWESKRAPCTLYGLGLGPQLLPGLPQCPVLSYCRGCTQSLLQGHGVSWQMQSGLSTLVTQSHAGPTRRLVINGTFSSNLVQNAHGTACGSLSNQVPNGSFSSLEEQVCIYLISISIGRYPGLDPPILSVSLL